MARRSSRCTPYWRSNSPTGAAVPRVAKYNSNLRAAVKRGRLSVFDMIKSPINAYGQAWQCATAVWICGQQTALPTYPHRLLLLLGGDRVFHVSKLAQ